MTSRPASQALAAPVGGHVLAASNRLAAPLPLSRPETAHCFQVGAAPAAPTDSSLRSE